MSDTPEKTTIKLGHISDFETHFNFKDVKTWGKKCKFESMKINAYIQIYSQPIKDKIKTFQKNGRCTTFQNKPFNICSVLFSYWTFSSSNSVRNLNCCIARQQSVK